MQISFTFTEHQITAAKDVFEICIWPAVLAYGKRSVRKAKVTINGFITDNVNRIRDEVTTHVDERMDTHEKSVFVRLGALEQTVKNCTQQDHSELTRPGKIQ